MDSIKKKMQSLANETANASARADRWEREVKRINETADQYEEQVRQLQKKIQEPVYCSHAQGFLIQGNIHDSRTLHTQGFLL
jgi:predicted  nucleic acid-binding Zn-ribbon protein